MFSPSLAIYILFTILSIYLYFEERDHRRQEWYSNRLDDEDFFEYDYYRTNRITEVNSFFLHLFWPFFAVILIHKIFKWVAKNIYILCK